MTVDDNQNQKVAGHFCLYPLRAFLTTSTQSYSAIAPASPVFLPPVPSCSLTNARSSETKQSFSAARIAPWRDKIKRSVRVSGCTVRHPQGDAVQEQKLGVSGRGVKGSP